MIKIFNTLTRKKEIFKPIDDKKVRMFVCGPTVYDQSHLGHARTYAAYDTIARYLRWRGFNLFYLMNITDVDDKIINRAKERKINPIELAREFEKSFHDDMKSLGIDSTDVFARASEHIQEIIGQIKRLVEKDFAYETETGVYYDITKFEDYGKLSHQNLEQLKKHRIEPDPTKKNPQDFALWKREKMGEIFWDSPWGRGRPGWHIEDTAIAEKYLGQQYDIHGGGIDLIFPHHEAEIAQMESVSGKKPMVNFWTHTEFLRISGEKMAKSLGNFITIKEALMKDDAEIIRLFFAFTHYRSPVDYNKKNIEKAKNSFETLYTTLENLQSVKTKDGKLTTDEKSFEKKLKEIKNEFIEVMDDDFNSPEGLRVLFELSTEINKFVSKNDKIDKKLKEETVKSFKEISGIFGILRKEIKKEKLDEDIERLVMKRENARKKGDWKTADDIRRKLKDLGIVLEDTQAGVKWKKVR